LQQKLKTVQTPKFCAGRSFDLHNALRIIHDDYFVTRIS
jgi:rRNA processing protein Krr1/Pno1